MGLISNGTTIFDNGAMASGFGGSMTFISSATASGSASIEFTLGDYKEYKFFFVNMHPSADGYYPFLMNFSTDSGSNYNVVKTTTFFAAFHNESNSTAALGYGTGEDLAQSTADQIIGSYTGGDNDQSMSGYFNLFNASSSTYVKHFMSNFNCYTENDFSRNDYVAGYANTVSPLTNIRFKFTTVNIDDGSILMFGVN